MTGMYWLVSLAALVGVVLNIRKCAWCFPIWVVTNAVWAFADWTRGLHAQAALMAVYCALAVYGALSWRKEASGGQ
jgi:nicotinamide riboside transporter PnuC